MITDIKSSPTSIEPIQFLADITIKEFVQQFAIVISESVRTNGSQYDITPPVRPNQIYLRVTVSVGILMRPTRKRHRILSTQTVSPAT